MEKYPEYDNLNMPKIAEEILKFWEDNGIFEKSVSNRENGKPFVFYEGPPSANGMPGIHHVLSRLVKDTFCRYHTMDGRKVLRKAGWDTHGLPVELGVEKRLGIVKDDIGKTISVEDYNKECRIEVMKYKDKFDEMTKQMGYWVDLKNPYVTYDSKYMESVWWLLKKLYDKKLLYKGLSIQPYSPAAGTGLSSHELNMPGCYKKVKDTSVTVQFKSYQEGLGEVFLLAWTTTPWTLPSNTALAVGYGIKYLAVNTFNQYTHKPVIVILAEDAMERYFPTKNASLKLEDYKAGDKDIPFEVVTSFDARDLVGQYEQLMPYAQPKDGHSFRVVVGDFVNAKTGTGIVHIAPSFGADDFKLAKKNGLASLTLVDKQGKFTEEAGEFAGRYVKNYKDDPAYVDVNIDIAVKLKKENRAFKIEKFEHEYPHCWRTDKPVLYYPLDSWFVKTSACKERMIELNKTINWKPEHIGTGRFGEWLNNMQDWNLSRSRFWGIPLPVWRTEDGTEEKCIGSIEELQEEIDKAVAYGVMEKSPLNENNIDLHKPFIDNVILLSDTGKKMHRESDLIDVWFDSGAMPYAQWHYPFENKEEFEKNFPADFIAEGVDQTRGWFYTLHAIAVMCFDSVAFKNVVSNGLMLDKNGIKMAKTKGNAVDPFDTMNKYGADAVRWYMLSNAQPWDDLRFDTAGIEEVQKKIFRVVHSTYMFFVKYANIDKFKYSEEEVPDYERPEIDRWILSELNELVAQVQTGYHAYEPTKSVRAIERFSIELLSNWYVRLCRRRFWKGEYDTDKISAYQTLYKCLDTLSKLMAPVAPFFADRLFVDLNSVTKKSSFESVHLTDFPQYQGDVTDMKLSKAMDTAMKLSSLAHSVRKSNKIRIRQPLDKMFVVIPDKELRQSIVPLEHLILSEVNVKSFVHSNHTGGVPMATDGTLSVALHLTITDELFREGLAREVVNKIQGIRKEMNLEITDKVNVFLYGNGAFKTAVSDNKTYICSEVLAVTLEVKAGENHLMDIEIFDGIMAKIEVFKVLDTVSV